jgi:hypothetical protein
MVHPHQRTRQRFFIRVENSQLIGQREAGWRLSGTDEVTVGYCLVFLHFWVQEW